ncbi:MAG: LuxR family transcriptional regulator [Bacteroidales bacterium]|nr:LuxR family transcriptional regulator [Bacteroidales bacterium]
MNDDTCKARVLIHKSEYEHFYKGNIVIASKYIDQALTIAKRINNERIFALINNIKGRYYNLNGDYVKAFVLYSEALRYFERVKDKHYMSVLYNSIGINFSSLNQPRKSIEYFKKALQINKELGNNYAEYVYLANLANCYVNLKMYETAITYYEQALKGSQQLRDSIGIFSTMNNIANSYLFENKNIDKALDYFQQGYKYAEKSHNLQKEIVALNGIGDIYIKQNKLIKARACYEKTLSLSQSEGFHEHKVIALLSLSEIEEKAGNWERAFKLKTQYINARDSSLNGETQKKISELQMQYQVEKKDYEFRLLQRKYDLKKTQNTILVISLSTFFIIAFLIGIILVLSNKNLQKNAKLKEQENIHLHQKMEAEQKIKELQAIKHQAEIENKNRDLTTASLQLVAKSELIGKILDNLSSFKQNSKIDNFIYDNLTYLINQNIDTDREWEQFKSLFEKVHNDFFTKLKSFSAGLTENELRLCAYIRIGLRNKEIAKILNVTPDSVKTGRYRIRKKINLDKESDLDVYIRNL